MAEPAAVLRSVCVALGIVASARLAAAQCPDGTPPPCGPQPVRAPAPNRNSIAVLPFNNRSPDTADVYLAEGMTEEVGNHLTQLSRLQVKARGVVEAQWRRSTDPVGAARALGVAWYVHGNVRHVAPQLVVNVELVRPATGEQVWARRFARPDGDVFAAQAEVAESVAVVVGGRLSPGERAVLTRRPTRNNEAYRLYLLGNALLKRRVQSEVRRALEAYTEATRLDPRFAAAWARIGIARTLQFAWLWDERVPLDSLLVLGSAASAHALALDSSSADAWLATGYAARNAADFSAARAAFERALALDSLNPDTWHWYAEMYWFLCDYDLAAPMYRRALSLDPTLRNTWRELGAVAVYAGRLAEAEAEYDSALSFGPWPAASVARAYARFLRRDAVGALADLAEAQRLDSVPYPYSDQRALYTVLLGDSAPARTVLTRLRGEATLGQPNDWRLAEFSMALGLREVAMSALQHLRDTPNPNEPRCARATPCSVSIVAWQALHNPIYSPLRDDPRFQRLWEETRPRVPWLEGYH